MITFTTAQSTAVLQSILDLQERNLFTRVSPLEAKEQGFVTVKHDLAMLERISGPYRHVVAMDGGSLAGYALVMLKEFGNDIPVLIPMFEQIDGMTIGARSFSEIDYFVMGQICIDKPYRGRGVFQGMYQELRRRMCDDFEMVVTEVATRNTRSLRAHANVGFQEVARYVSPENESWNVISWPLKLQRSPGLL
jgi:hypothetical protein